MEIYATMFKTIHTATSNPPPALALSTTTASAAMTTIVDENLLPASAGMTTVCNESTIVCDEQFFCTFDERMLNFKSKEACGIPLLGFFATSLGQLRINKSTTY